MRSPTRQLALPLCLLAPLFTVAALAAKAPPPVGGEVLWRFEIPGNAPGKFVGVGVDGRVYTTNFSPGDLYALTPNGSLIWSLGIGIASGNWPITFASDGTIYTGAVGVRAVNPNGTLRWAFDPGSWIIAGPSVGLDGNVYAADDAAAGGLGFFSLDPGGHLRWSNPGEPPASGLYEGLDEIVFGNGRLFGGIHFLRSGPWINTYAFDLDGHQLWNRYYGPDGGPSSNPRLLPDGRLIFRSGQGSLAALFPNGTDEWVEPHPDGAQQLVPPAVGPDGAIYAGDVYGIQLWSAHADGTVRWVKGAITNEYLASLGVSPDNGVLVASGWTYSPSDGLNHGWIRGYDPANGDQRWQLDLEFELGEVQLTRTVRPAFSPDGDRAYVTTWFTRNGVGHSYLYAIALRETAPVGVPVDGPGALEIPRVSISPNPCFGPAKILVRTGSSPASIGVYDLAGRKVRQLFEGSVAGSVHLEWDLLDQQAHVVRSGVYVVKARTPAGTSATRVVVAR